MKITEQRSPDPAPFRIPWRFIFILCFCLTLSDGVIYAQAFSSATGLRYENAVISEDVTWRGNITISDSLTIASQATVRIEPGTRIQAVSTIKHQLPRLVVMGRIQALGTSENPVVFTAESGKWGGILFLSSMKKNQFENCRIEQAERGIEARFSSVSTSKIHISHATTGFALYDSVATSSLDTVSDCNTAYRAVASEIEMKNSTLTENQDALLLLNSSAVISGATVMKNKNSGVTLNKGRLIMISSTVSENGVGLDSQSGEGEIRLCRFTGNRVAGLKLLDSPLKINRTQIVDNPGDGIQLQDARTALWSNIILGNGHANFVYSGADSFSAVQNWWGSADERVIEGGVSVNSPGVSVMLVPWLKERPQLP